MKLYESRSDAENYIYLHRQGEPFEGNEIYRISCHSNFHKATEFIFITHGSARYNVNGKQGELTEGDILFVDSFLPHSYSTSEDIDGYVIVLSEWYFQFFRREYENKVFPMVLGNKEENRKLLGYLAGWHGRWMNETAYESYNSANIFLAKLCKVYTLSPRKSSKGDDLIFKMLTYIEEHYTEDISLGSIAGQLGYVKQYCSKVFNRAMQESFRKYLNRVRVNHFNELMEKEENRRSETVLKIAYACGFESQSTFYRAYRELYGATPRFR